MDIRKTDRRQNNIAIENDRRSGLDRRENPSLFYALETVPTFRRVASITNKLYNDDKIGALGSIGLALINLPEDLRDVKGSLKQLTGAKPKYNYKEYQHNFSFFRGTLIEDWLHKQADKGKKWANWLIENDQSLADTKFGEKILNTVKAEEYHIVETQIKDIDGLSILATSYKGNKFAQLTARAFKRMTLLGLLVMGLFELPKIFKSDKKVKQIAKSAINVATITAGIGYGGAIGSKCKGPIGSLIGMGLGAIVANKASEKAQNLI